jgi:hypothetical protein
LACPAEASSLSLEATLKVCKTSPKEEKRKIKTLALLSVFGGFMAFLMLSLVVGCSMKSFLFFLFGCRHAMIGVYLRETKIVTE